MAVTWRNAVAHLFETVKIGVFFFRDLGTDFCLFYMVAGVDRPWLPKLRSFSSLKGNKKAKGRRTLVIPEMGTRNSRQD